MVQWLKKKAQNMKFYFRKKKSFLIRNENKKGEEK